jgi:hypothetical protein
MIACHSIQRLSSPTDRPLKPLIFKTLYKPSQKRKVNVSI